MAKKSEKTEKNDEKDPFAAGDILGLSAEELRKRALKIDPFRTAWIGRVDTIPPQSDERTAIIDRGLMLRGLLNKKQLDEIHEVGDLWIEHHEAAALAETHAQKQAKKAVADLKKEKQKLKEKKKKEAATREKKHREGIAHRRATDIIYLGQGVSPKLNQRESNQEALTQRGLPLLSTPADVAKILGLPIPKLRWLCYHTEAAEKTHYVYFEIPKRSGGKRLLSAPMPTLAKAQEWVLHNILEKLPTEEPAHGFIKAHSTVTNAIPHLQKDLVVNLDLSDFFPTITYRRVRGFFEKLGYSPAVSTLLALLCTECPRRPVEYDGKRYQVAIGERALPQGACTSPAISNQISRTLDKRLLGMSKKHGWVYTRYADDLTFSTTAEKKSDLPMMLARVRHIVSDEGFALNPKKGRVQRRSTRQCVTGIVVNDKPGLPREDVRKLRAILHQAQKTGLEAQNREKIPHFEAWLRGKLSYLSMVDPIKGKAMLAQLELLKK
jgi:RNA-directed DNA polymerase